MKPRLVLSLAASCDIFDAATWYEDQRLGLGEEFLLAVEATLEQILTQPEMFSFVERDIRRAMVRRFPFGVFYSMESDHLGVIGVLHASRDPEALKSRR